VNHVLKIVSGGQTGADRAALDFALEHGIRHGGWCPKGRGAEDGPIEPKYLLKDTPSPDSIQRTEWNARDSDGTVVFSIEEVLTGGCKETVEFAQKHGKPVLHLSRTGPAQPELALRRFIHDHDIKVLNVAGPKASKEPEGTLAGFGSASPFEPGGTLTGFEPASRRCRPTVSRWRPSSRAIRRFDQPCAANVNIECCKLTLSSFIALMCSLGCSIRNASLKVAYFEVPIPGRFSLPADSRRLGVFVTGVLGST
jgi:hypothetical protein